MLEDTFEGMEDDDLEEAAQEEVDKILFEVTKGNCKFLYFFMSYYHINHNIYNKILEHDWFPHAYLSHNRHVIKWVSNYR